ncbi:MAG: methyltransferase domain-containing protein [Acidobacteria bacterium]|nr:methyltransferase domain-containing protein [Acidobacteriota bacterium]
MADIQRNQIHETAIRGYTSSADCYERARPEYPAALLDYLTDTFLLSGEQRVLELGAGTGKFTRLLLRSNSKIVVLEPVPPMQKQFRLVLPSTPLLSGIAERLPIKSQSIDLVCSAQSFHWFQVTNAAEEIHRVLKPHGKLVLVWNVRDERFAWVRRMSELMAPFQGTTPRYHSGEWKRVLESLGLFSPLQLVQFHHCHSASPELVLERIASVSFVAALDVKNKTRLLESMRQMMQTHPETAGKTVLEMPYRTDLFYCDPI